MAALTCPRCASVAEFPLGSNPVCPACGYPGPDARMWPQPPPSSGAGKIVGIVVGVVVGSILLTVVLAAVVFVLVQNLSRDPGDRPDVAFADDQSARMVTVIQAPSGRDAVDWVADIEMAGSCAASATLNGGAWPTAPGRTLRVGDQVGCPRSSSLTITHLASGAVLHSTSFP